MNMAVQNVPRSDDETIEHEIQRKGKTAPRITPTGIESVIVSQHFFTGAEACPREPIPEALRLLTFCVLVLENGFTVTGESACASPENFDAEIGRAIARQNAVAKIWPLEGYLLKQRLSESK